MPLDNEYKNGELGLLSSCNSVLFNQYFDGKIYITSCKNGNSLPIKGGSCGSDHEVNIRVSLACVSFSFQLLFMYKTNLYSYQVE